jgi:hypothetical protein
MVDRALAWKGKLPTSECIKIFKMIGDFSGPRFRRRDTFFAPKKYQRRRHPWFRSSFIHPGCLEGLRHPGLLTGNLVEASDGDRRFSSRKRGGAFRRRASNVGESCWI